MGEAMVAGTDVMSAPDMIRAFARGDLTPIEVTEAVLDAAEAANPRLGAFNAFDNEGARAAAGEATERWTSWRHSAHAVDTADWQRLPHWGVPVTIKDTIEQAGLPTTYGSLAFSDNHQPDSPLVTRLRESGCVLLGKTNTSEFALSMVTETRLSPPARNPHDLSRTAGGSSGGAAAATAAGFGIFGLGTDSVGSIRQPAAFCGLYGFKPSTGRVTNGQQWSASPLRSHLGPLTRKVEDLVFAWQQLTGDSEPLSPAEREEVGSPLRVGVCQPDERAVIRDGLDLLRATGLTGEAPIEVDLPIPPETYSKDGTWIFSADHLAAAEKLKPDFMARFGDQLTGYARKVYSVGDTVRAWEYRKLTAEVVDFRNSAQRLFGNVDLYLSPVAGIPPVLRDHSDLDGFGPAYPELAVWNLAGNPAVVVPLPLGDDGYPRGLQIVAAPGRDRALIRIALAMARLGQPVQAVSQSGA